MERGWGVIWAMAKPKTLSFMPRGCLISGFLVLEHKPGDSFDFNVHVDNVLLLVQVHTEEQ